MLEPRGHSDMYGALLRPDTELTATGEAHMGALFMTNDGFSTMCGHATIALGRFLLDTHDLRIFPRRDVLVHDPRNRTTSLTLHAPCGLVRITVPTNADGSKADPSRPVSFISVPSFATGVDVRVPIPGSYRWPQLGERDHVTADFSYGGAFYCMIPATELGFPGGLAGIDLEAANRATRLLKAAVNANDKLRALFSHPDHEDLGFLYSIMVVDDKLGVAASGSEGVETGLCFFANQQIDRSPTGGGVAARIVLAHAKGKLEKGQAWTYNSLVSNAYGGRGSLTGRMVEVLEISTAGDAAFQNVYVEVEGFAYYTGFHCFVSEEQDALGEEGFVFDQLHG